MLHARFHTVTAGSGSGVETSAKSLSRKSTHCSKGPSLPYHFRFCTHMPAQHPSVTCAVRRVARSGRTHEGNCLARTKDSIPRSERRTHGHCSTKHAYLMKCAHLACTQRRVVHALQIDVDGPRKVRGVRGHDAIAPALCLTTKLHATEHA